MSATIISPSRRIRLRSATLVASAAWIACGPAAAQSMDYGALQALFGEPVTTSATGSPQRASEVPANMIIVTADEIRRSGATDIPGVLSRVAGIDILQWSADNTDVSVRGYNQAYSARLLVLIDGRQVYADYYGFTPWSTLPVELSAIRQIEIVKGPNSALFGFNAVGGVINIITYNPLYDDVKSASVAAGSQAFAEASGVATFRPTDDTAFRLSLGGFDDEGFSTAIPRTMAGVQSGDNSRITADFRGSMRLNDHVELGLDLSHSQALLNEMDPGYAFDYSKYITNSTDLTLLADTNFGLIKFSTYANWISDDTTLVQPLGHLRIDSEVTVVQAEDLLRMGNDNTLRFAAEYRHDSLNTFPTTGGTVTYSIMSGSVMWGWRIATDLSLTNAVRVDNLTLGRSGFIPPGYPLNNDSWNVTHDDVSANSGLVWKYDSEDTIRLIVARGVQSPSLADAGGILLTSATINVTGVPTLNLTDIMNYEADWDREIPSWDMKIRADVFHQDSSDLVGISDGILLAPPTVYITPTNIGSSHADGAEILLSGTIDKGWRWGLSERAEFVRDNFLPSAIGTSDTDYQHTTPTHLVNANLGWSDEKWEADGFLRYQTDTSGLQPTPSGTRLTPIGAYASLDARIAYHLLNWATLAVSGENLLTAQQQQTSGPLVERRIVGSVSITF